MVGWVRWSLVGVSVFKTPKSERSISSEILLPLVSLSGENQRGSWALKSPRTRESVAGRRLLMKVIGVNFLPGLSGGI